MRLRYVSLKPRSPPRLPGQAAIRCRCLPSSKYAAPTQRLSITTENGCCPILNCKPLFLLSEKPQIRTAPQLASEFVETTLDFNIGSGVYAAFVRCGFWMRRLRFAAGRWVGR